MSFQDQDKRSSDEPRGNVLVVDDVDAVSGVFARVLAAAGYVVERADNGETATEHLRRQRFDVVLSDIGMPGMDGIALLRTVRERDLDVPVLLITGNPTVESAAKAVEYGALRYLTKPIAPKDLVTEVGKAVRLGRIKRVAHELEGESYGQLGDRAGLEVCLARAIDALWMAYQPIVRCSDKSVVAFEALMRSNEPKLPHPEAMLRAADRLGRLTTLGRAVRKHVGDTMTSAASSPVFVNLHPQELLDEELFTPETVLARNASNVVLEITERSSLDEVQDVSARIARLRELGFRIALDDMGAGYAGLTAIAQIEPEVLKLDMTLVRNVDREPTKQKLVHAMTSLCREMNVLVVAEGVETSDERDALLSLGCDVMQGYLFARPAPPFPTVQF